MKIKVMHIAVILLICLSLLNNIYAIQTPEGRIPKEESGISIPTDEELKVEEIFVENPYNSLNTLEKALANKTSVIWIVVTIVVIYLIIVIVVLKLTKKRWK